MRIGRRGFASRGALCIHVVPPFGNEQMITSSSRMLRREKASALSSWNQPGTGRPFHRRPDDKIAVLFAPSSASCAGAARFMADVRRADVRRPFRAPLRAKSAPRGNRAAADLRGGFARACEWPLAAGAMSDAKFRVFASPQSLRTRRPTGGTYGGIARRCIKTCAVAH